MGKLTPTGPELARSFAVHSFTGTGAGPAMQMVGGNFVNATLSGTFEGLLRLERSFDGGTTWVNRTDQYQMGYVFSVPGSTALPETEPGVLYRFRCETYVSGTIVTRLSC